MALLITLSIIAILLTASLELNRRVRLAILSSEISKTEYKLLTMAKSGMILAEAVLIKDVNTNQIDSVQEEWSDPETLNKIVTSIFTGPGEITLHIVDEMGKIQVNALINEYPGHEVNMDQKKIWENLLSLFISSDKSRDDRDPQQIINCLIDWLDDMDNDAITGVSGAESAYYESLDIPYACANRPFHDLNQLFLVKGITQNLVTRAAVLDKILSDPDAQEPPLHLEDLFTVFGFREKKPGSKATVPGKYGFSGKININTAPVPVIASLLPFGKQDLAESIDAYRISRPDKEEGFANDLSIKEWYAGIAGLTDTEKIKMMEMVTYSSHIFTIESKATLNGRSLVLKNTVLRHKNKKGQWVCKTLRQVMD